VLARLLLKLVRQQYLALVFLLNSFNRTELSGVIAHEIGHIVNQDIKLNIQISAFVFGFSADAQNLEFSESLEQLNEAPKDLFK
jgi:Zn-dependent protease with chaperone function